MDNEILLAILGSASLSSLLTYAFTRRKLAAETVHIQSQAELNDAEEADTFAEAITKLTANNSGLQSDNKRLFQENIALEKALTDSDRARENLAIRLQTRDEQISTLNRQLATLQNREKHSEITEALNTQLQAVTQIRQSYETIIQDRDRTIRELLAKTGPLPQEPRLPQGPRQRDGERDGVPALPREPRTKQP